MQPIVNGIQEEYTAQVKFVLLNATDGGDGETIFQSLGLPGHPSIVIFAPDGEEVYRQFGIIDEFTLIDAIDKIVGQ
jgi:hypothetical protein